MYLGNSQPLDGFFSDLWKRPLQQFKQPFKQPLRQFKQPFKSLTHPFNPTSYYRIPGFAGGEGFASSRFAGGEGFGFVAGGEGFAASAGGAAGGAAKGAAAGMVAGPWGAAVGAVIGAASSLMTKKPHLSPWGFPYDDYAQKIYENEITINALRNAIARYTGQPQTSDPPMYSKKGGTQYQASMQAIVPRYVPGSESQIAAYDRRLNEGGGAYEQTVQRQIALAPQLQQQLQVLQQTSQPLPIQPASGSATAPLPYGPPGPQPFQAPQTAYSGGFSPPPLLPQYQPGPTMTPLPGGGSAPQLSDLFGGSMSGNIPYILGAIGLAAILLTQNKTRHRPRVARTRR